MVQVLPSLLHFIIPGLQNMAQETGSQVNYQAVGSGSGVRQFTAKTVDFGASDGAVSDTKAETADDPHPCDWWCYCSCL